MRVLDAGFGRGRLTIPLAYKVGTHGSVTAVDMQIQMLERVKHKADVLQLKNIILNHNGLGNGKLEQSFYDRVLISAVFGEIPNQLKAMQELFLSLKPGGLLAIAELIFDPHFQSRSSVTILANYVGFNEKVFFGNRFAYLIIFEKPIC
jgi:ubiquinone/menaquinone biosynthesis C-methylase UbiE